MLSRAFASCLVACALAACGSTVRIQGTADQVWNDTIEILRIQGVMPATIPSGKIRPRADRNAGEIDLPYSESEYYGDGAAFIQVDMSQPLRNSARTVRMWVDFPVGNRVVRYGRALDEATTAQFVRDFEVALSRYRVLHPERRPPTPEEVERQVADEDVERRDAAGEVERRDAAGAERASNGTEGRS